MQRLIYSLLKKIYLDSFVREFVKNLKTTKQNISWHFKRKFGRIDSGIVRDYLNKDGEKKLHIGCANNILNDWLNSDFFPSHFNVLHLDATETFPVPSEKFDYVFSEHMIEHISYTDGLKMLSECYRVLKNNGKIRISTPDFRFLIDLYKDNKTELQIEYVKWATDNFVKSAPSHDAIFVINNFVRDWGHLFIYDEKTLCSSLEKSGFTLITRCNLNESNDMALQNLENDKRLPGGFLALESFTLEATKTTNDRF